MKVNPQREPLVVRGVIIAVLNTLLVFGLVQFSDAQMDSLVVTLDAVIALVVMVVWGRQAVTPVAAPKLDDEAQYVVEPLPEGVDVIPVDDEDVPVSDEV